MAAYPGTHVHTADGAVPPLNDDLAGLIDDLHGFHPAVDLLADAARALALATLTVRDTQAALTLLAGSTDPAGQQIDAKALITALTARLLDADQNPCLRDLDPDTQEQARQTGLDLIEHDAYTTDRQTLAKTIYTLNPI